MELEKAKRILKEAKESLAKAKKHKEWAEIKLTEAWEQENNLIRGETALISKRTGERFIFASSCVRFASVNHYYINVFKIRKNGEPYSQSKYGGVLEDFEVL